MFEEAYRRLTSRDPKYAWTSGQWMTERSGGSDVSGTETLATRLTADELARDEAAGRGEDAAGMPLGPWHINGFKWFSSATDSDMAILLARTANGLRALAAICGTVQPILFTHHGFVVETARRELGDDVDVIALA